MTSVKENSVEHRAIVAKRDKRSDTGKSEQVSITQIKEMFPDLEYEIGNLATIEGGYVGVLKTGNPVCVLRDRKWILDNGDDLEVNGIPTIDDVEPWVYDFPDKEDRRYIIEVLRFMEGGGRPSSFTMGAEIEGSTYAEDCDLLPKTDPHEEHPELVLGTVERATTIHNNLASLAKDIGEQVLYVYKAFPEVSYYNLSSVAEAGDLLNFRINPHRYVRLMHEYLINIIDLDDIDPRAKKIINKVAGAYALEAENLLCKLGLTIWTCQAFHSHTGVSKLARDSARCNGEIGVREFNLLKTPAWGLITLMTSNTAAIAGVPIETVADVRNNLRRLFPTACETPPLEGYTPELLQVWIDTFVAGAIHTPARFPEQHGSGRMRTNWGTVENTNTNQHPHLGVDLAIVAAQALLKPIALESYIEDKSVFKFAQARYGIPFGFYGRQFNRALYSCFDRDGWDGKVEINGKILTLRELAWETARAFTKIGRRYSSLSQEAKTAACYLVGSTINCPDADIEGYFDPSRGGVGVLTEIKLHSSLAVEDIVRKQATATKKQAQILTEDPDIILNPPHLIDIMNSVL